MKSTPNRGQLLSAVLIVSSFTCVQSQADLKARELQTSLLKVVLTGLSKVVEFFGSRYQEVNMDAVFCIRLCQGNLVGILEDCGSNRLLCLQEVTQEIQAINERLNVIVDMTRRYIEKENKLLFVLGSELIKKPFTIRYVAENLTNIVEEAQIYNEYHESDGSRCYVNLLGNDVSDSGIVSTIPRCTISDNCWWLMTRGGSGRYYLTHQILYTIISEHVGCEAELAERFSRHRGDNIRDFQRRLCEQVYVDVALRQQTISADIEQQDLFMEQIAICGMLGFQNFFNDSWIQMILGWQTTNGCFSNIVSPDAASRHRQKRTDGIEAQLDDVPELSDNDNHIMVRAEKLMSDGCLSHKTGVATSAMGAFMRYLVSEIVDNTAVQGSELYSSKPGILEHFMLMSPL